MKNITNPAKRPLNIVEEVKSEKWVFGEVEFKFGVVLEIVALVVEVVLVEVVVVAELVVVVLDLAVLELGNSKGPVSGPVEWNPGGPW